MATLFKPKEDKEKEINAAPQTSTMAAPTIGTPQAQAQASQAPTSSGRFTNLSKYLEANKNAGLGSRVVTKAQGDVSKGEEIKKQGEGVLSTVKQATPTIDTTATEAVKSGNYTPEQLEAVKNLQSTTYSGPTEVSGNLATQQQALQNISSGANTAEGRFGLLKNYLGRPQYTSGQQNLDRLFLARSTPDIQKITSLGSTAGQLAGDIGQVSSNIGTAIGAAKTAADTAKTKAGEAITGGISTLGGLGQTQYQQSLADPNSYASLLNSLGVSAPEATNWANTLNADQIARYNTLAQMAGNTPLISDTKKAAFDLAGNINTKAREDFKAYDTAQTEKNKLEKSLPNYQNTVKEREDYVNKLAEAYKSVEVGRREGATSAEQNASHDAEVFLNSLPSNALEKAKADLAASQQGLNDITNRYKTASSTVETLAPNYTSAQQKMSAYDKLAQLLGIAPQEAVVAPTVQVAPTKVSNTPSRVKPSATRNIRTT